MIWNPDENQPGGNDEPTTGNEQPTEAQSPTDSAGAAESQSSTAAPQPNEERRPRRRGFAAMNRDRVREIASKGGKAAHAAGTAHQFSSDEARVAGRKGGMAPHVRRGGVRRRPISEEPIAGPIGGSGSVTSTGEHGGDNR